MENIQLILLVLVFVSLAVMMFLRKIPALLALPLMAFLIPVISGVPLMDTIEQVIGEGATRLAEAYTIAIFGSMLSIMLQKTGVAENFIKIGAELSGDKPWTIALIMLILITLLFTTLGGLGAIIMVSTVVLPILASVGVGPVTTVGIFLFGLSIGGILNVGNWAVYMNVLMLSVDEVRGFALIMFGIAFFVAMVYITIQLYRDGHDINFKRIGLRTLFLFLFAAALGYGYTKIGEPAQNTVMDIFGIAGTVVQYTAAAIMILLVVISIIRMFRKEKSDEIFFGAYFIPVIPLVLILLFEMNFIAAFVVGLIYGFISTYRKNSLNILVRSVLEGGAVVMPAVALMFGIGMLLNAVMGPSSASTGGSVRLNDTGSNTIIIPEAFRTGDNESNVLVKLESKELADTIAASKQLLTHSWQNDSVLVINGSICEKVGYELRNWPVVNILRPVFSKIIPDNPLLYIIMFTLMAPLALYRGPLNVWGMGYGIAAIFLASGMMPGAIMGLLLAVGQVQGISDPTNTQNVWLANEMRIDVQKILWNTIPYTWAAALLGLIAAALMFM